MPKPPLKEQYRTLEGDLIVSLINGLHEWRRDLNYPQSHSDLSACIRRVIREYVLIKRSQPLTDDQIEDWNDE